MALEYRKFTVVAGEVRPSVGATGIALTDGNVVWIGEEGTWPGGCPSTIMTQDEIDYYIWITEFPDRLAAAKVIFEDSILWDVSYANVDTYIDSNVTDLAEAKAFLKKLSKVVLANLKFNGLVK